MNKKVYQPCNIKVLAIQCQGFLAHSTINNVTEAEQLARETDYWDDIDEDEE